MGVASATSGDRGFIVGYDATPGVKRASSEWPITRLRLDAYLVEVETDIASGLPVFVIVDLPQGPVKEGRDSVYAATNAGVTFPLKRITG